MAISMSSYFLEKNDPSSFFPGTTYIFCSVS